MSVCVSVSSPGRNAFFTGAPETRLRALLEASREAQNAVSEKLSGQVLGALHELLRGLHRAAPDRIETLAEADPHHLYEGLLTCLMRLVFLLYAEDRDLLPSSRDAALKALWENGYSIKTLYARLLVDRSVAVQPGWQVFVRSTPLARLLWLPLTWPSAIFSPDAATWRWRVEPR